MSSSSWRDRSNNTPIGGYSSNTNAGNSLSHSYNKIPAVSENSTLLKATSTKPSVDGQRSAPQFPGQRKDDHPLSTNVKDRALTSPALAGEVEATNTKVSPRDSEDAVNGHCVSSHDTKNPKGKTARFSDLPRASKYIIVLLTMAHTLHMMSYSLIGPFYTKEALKKGTSQGQIGLIFSIFSIVVFISTPIFGAYIAVIGPRFLLFSGILTSGSSCILFGVLEYCPGGVTFTAMSYLVRGFDGLGVSAYTVGAYSIAFSACPDHVTFVAGILQSAVTIGMCIGPVIGSVLFEAGGFGLPFYTVGVVILINGVMVYISVSEKIVVNESRKTSISRFSLLRNPLAWLAFATSGLFTGTLGSLSANLAVYVSKTMGSSALIVGLMFALWPLVYAINSPLLGWLCKKQGVEQFLNPVSIFAVGFGFALLGPNPILSFLPRSEWIVFVGLAVLGAAYSGCTLSSVKMYFVSAMEKGMEDNLDTFGMISSLLNSGCSFGAFWGAAASGYITASLGFPSTVAITSTISWIVMLISIVLFLLRRRKKVLEEKRCLLSSTDPGKDSGDGVAETSLAAKNESKTTLEP